MDRVIVVAGPTATGKTALGALLARQLGGEVIGADSMQVYRDMSVGTTRPTEEEMLGVPHHMIGCVSPFEDFSVSRYVSMASRCVEDVLSRGRVPVLVGGTGLYIDALLSGTDFAQKSSPALREELSARYDELGGHAMLERLAEFDPGSAAKLAPADKHRIVRAFEIYTLTGVSKTEHDRAARELPERYPSRRIVLNFRDRADLYGRIDRRVDEMARLGLVQEVRRLLEMGVPENGTAMQAIGYKELARAIKGGQSTDAALEEIKLRSRQYAKRQISWFARWKDACRIDWEKATDTAAGCQIATAFLHEQG